MTYETQTDLAAAAQVQDDYHFLQDAQWLTNIFSAGLKSTLVREMNL